MPYVTSVLQVTNVGALTSLKTNWNDDEKRVNAEKFIQKFFSKVKIPRYDAYFLFPKGSHICIRQTTNNEFLLDCYSNKLKKCTTDFSHALRRLRSISPFTIESVDFESEATTLETALYETLISGGALLFVLPLLVEKLVPVDYRLTSYIVAALLYIIGVTFYSWRKTD